jgi:hypothetical protein
MQPAWGLNLVADNEVKAEIVFDDNEMMGVQNTVLEITGEIEGQKRMALPLIKVIDEDGAEVWINATHIRTIRGRPGVE